MQDPGSSFQDPGSRIQDPRCSCVLGFGGPCWLGAAACWDVAVCVELARPRVGRRVQSGRVLACVGPVHVQSGRVLAHAGPCWPMAVRVGGLVRSAHISESDASLEQATCLGIASSWLQKIAGAYVGSCSPRKPKSRFQDFGLRGAVPHVSQGMLFAKTRAAPHASQAWLTWGTAPH